MLKGEFTRSSRSKTCDMLFTMNLLLCAALSAHANDEDPESTINDQTHTFTSHGYLRIGALFDLDDSLSQYDAIVHEQGIGRLGVESENRFEIAFNNYWQIDKQQWVNITLSLGTQETSFRNSEEDADTLFGLSIDGKNIGLIESYVSVGGFLGDPAFTSLWAGRRYYERPNNYIYINDYYLTDYSGTGIGIEKLPFWSGFLDLAWITSDLSGNSRFDEAPTSTSEVMHAFHAGYTFSQTIDFDALVKYYPNNGEVENGLEDDGSTTTSSDSELATNGIEFTASFHYPSFYGLDNRGFSQFVVQAGRGLSSGTGLGCLLSNYCAFRQGGSFGNGISSLIGGFDQDRNLDQIDSSDLSTRFSTYGAYYGHSLLLFPQLSIQLDKSENTQDRTYTAFTLRPILTFPLDENFFLAFEVGYETESFEDSEVENSLYKVAMAPTWSLHGASGTTPEIRLILGMIGGENLNDNSSSLVLGFQSEVWW